MNNPTDHPTPPAWQAPQPAPPAPPRPWYHKKWVWAASVLTVLAIAGSASSGDKKDPAALATQQGKVTATTAAPPAAAPATTAKIVTTTTEAPTTTTTEAPTTTTTRLAAWVKVATLTGTGDKNGSTFALQGGEQRLRWSVTGYRPGVDPHVVSTSFYVEPGSGAPSDQNGPGSDSSSVYNEAGNYHIEVLSANANWTVTLEELR